MKKTFLFVLTVIMFCSGAFNWCYELTDLVIGIGVTSVCEYSFYCCNSLTNVYYTGSKSEWEAISIGSCNEDLTRATIHYNYVPEN